MASFLLRLGRTGSFKQCFRSEGWIVLQNYSVASFCTQAAEPPKTPKKTKTSSKTEAPDERAALLAYRTSVIFPVKLSEPPVFPVQAAGDAAADVEPFVHHLPTACSKSVDPAADGSSSSSSDSDSDSDSDSNSDDEASQVRASAPEASEYALKKKPGVLRVTSEMKEDANKAKPEPKPTPDSAAEAEEFIDSAPEICTSPKGTLEGAPATTPRPSAEEPESELTLEPTEHAESSDGPDVPAEIFSAAAPPKEAPAAAPVEITESISSGTPREAAANPVESVENIDGNITPVEDAPDAAGAEAAEDIDANATCVEDAAEPIQEGPGASAEVTEAATVKGSAEAAAGVSAPAGSSEQLVDPAPVVAESVGEELQAEASSEVAAAAPPPEPEEPFDISTYKNYEHHNYHPFTFADLDVEMAKFRLPQPSAARR